MTLPSERAALAVTTNGSSDPRLVASARAAAQRWEVPYVERRRKAPLWPLFETHADAFLVFSQRGVSLWDQAGSLTYDPGIAHLRIKQLDAGIEEDTLLKLAELGPGMSFLDCTLGLAQDALVAARAVGPEGRVVGLEKSLALFAVVSSGLEARDYGPRSCRIQAVHSDAMDFLIAQPAGAFDCVLIDPMFERPGKSQPSFEVLRRYAEAAPLSQAWVEQARRVARRTVIIKASRHSLDLGRLNLRPEAATRHSKRSWVRIRL